jgi:hypothetical protein
MLNLVVWSYVKLPLGFKRLKIGMWFVLWEVGTEVFALIYGLTTLPQPPVYLEQCYSACFSGVPL